MRYKVVVVILACIGALNWSYAQHQMHYSILPESTLTLSGKSNVSKFSCTLQDNFNAATNAMIVRKEAAVLKIEGAVIAITIHKFECSNGQMERDLQKALGAETYPIMYLKIKEINYSAGVEGVLANKETSALVEITIGEVSKLEQIAFYAVSFRDDILRFSGSQRLNMEEYSITPPVALFGLIQVRKWVDIEFELHVEIKKGL